MLYLEEIASINGSQHAPAIWTLPILTLYFKEGHSWHFPFKINMLPGKPEVWSKADYKEGMVFNITDLQIC